MVQPVDNEDTALIEAARRIIAQRARPEFHQIGAALRTCHGRVFSAVNLDTSIGRTAVCAEAACLGMAAAVGDTEIEVIVAVNVKGQVVSPCGICREMISDYAPDARVIVPGRQGPESLPVMELLPRKYRKD